MPVAQTLHSHRFVPSSVVPRGALAAAGAFHASCANPRLAPSPPAVCRDVLAAAGVRVEVDWRRRGPAGVRFGDSERRGVPLRIEVRRGLCWRGILQVAGSRAQA